MNNMLRFLTVRSAAGLLVGSFLLLDVSVAAPSILSLSGEVKHGQLVTISGSGFGSHPNYNNIGDTWNGHKYLNFRWTDFSFSTFPSQASYASNPTQSDGFYPQYGGAYWTAWSKEGLSLENGGPAVSGQYLKRRVVPSEAGELGGPSVDMPNEADNYSNLFIQLDFMMYSPSGRQQSGKFLRVWGDGAAGSIYLSSGGPNLELRGDGSYEDCPAGFNGDSIEWGSPDSFQLGKWDQVTMASAKSSGVVSVFINNKFQWSHKWWCGFGLGGHTIDFPNMIDQAYRGYGEDGSYNFTNIFVNFTQARIVLGNRSTYTMSTRLEPQLPVVWTPTSVQFAVNSGTFSTGDTAYVYIVDEAGSRNESGYIVTISSAPLTIGGGGSSAPLGAPSNLKITQ